MIHVFTATAKKQQQKLPGGRIRDGDAKWRRRIMKQLAEVIRRLDRLETQNENRKDKVASI